jgi:hypothetical protein
MFLLEPSAHNVDPLSHLTALHSRELEEFFDLVHVASLNKPA